MRHFAILHHMPGGIDLSISEFCNFIIYCFLATLIISIISLRILRKLFQSYARFRNIAFLCTGQFLFLILHFISLFIQGFIALGLGTPHHMQLLMFHYIQIHDNYIHFCSCWYKDLSSGGGGHINLPLSVRPDIDTWFVWLSPPTVLELQL